MVVEKLCRILYELDNHALFSLSSKTLEEALEAYKNADIETRKKILEIVDLSTKEKITAMVDGGLL